MKIIESKIETSLFSLNCQRCNNRITGRTHKHLLSNLAIHEKLNCKDDGVDEILKEAEPKEDLNILNNSLEEPKTDDYKIFMNKDSNSQINKTEEKS